MSIANQEQPQIRTAPSVTGIHHAGLTVRDIDASEQWYCRVLGLSRAFVEPHDNDTGYAVVMTRPGTSLFLGLDHHGDADLEMFSESRTGLDHLSFRVNSRLEIDAWAAHLDSLGVSRAPVHEVAEPMRYALIVFRDLDGIQLELMWFDA